MKAIASICITPQYMASVPTLQLQSISRAEKGLTVETEGLTVLELRSICRDVWEALACFSPTQCLAPIYIFYIQLVWRLKSPWSQYRSVCFRERPCTQHAHAEHLRGKNKLGALKTSFSMLCSLHIPSHKQIAGHKQPPFAYRDTVVLISLIHYLLWFTCSHRSAHLGLARLPEGPRFEAHCGAGVDCRMSAIKMDSHEQWKPLLGSSWFWAVWIPGSRESLFLQTLVLHESLLQQRTLQGERPLETC